MLVNLEEILKDAKARKYGVGVMLLEAASGTDAYRSYYLRGEIRIVWRERGDVSVCNTFAAFGNMDTVTKRIASASSGCDFFSLPFALKRTGTL